MANQKSSSHPPTEKPAEEKVERPETAGAGDKQGAFDWMSLLGTILQFVQTLRKKQPVADSTKTDTFGSHSGADALHVLAYHQSCALAQTLEMLKSEEDCEEE